MGFCRFDYRANLQKLEMTSIWHVNVAPSAGDWSKQLYLHAGAGSCRHHLERGLHHLLDGLPLRNAACQEPGRSDQAQKLPNSAIFPNDRFGGIYLGGRAPAALARAS